jgi:hypothetical protein
MTQHPSAGLCREFLVTAEPPGLGPDSRPGITGLQTLNHRLDEALRDAPLPHASVELVRALVLLWHDYLDASHSISQRVDTEDGAYLHGMMHRREPDYWNAKYWFRQAGRHRISPSLAKRAAALLEAANEPGLRDKLVPGGEWDPFAFVDACEQAEKLAHSASVRQTLRAVQAAEFALLLDYLLGESKV